jgi:hypothetical protein
VKTYSKTNTLGNGPYTGQKRLVADALLKSDRPLTACEITVLANLDGAYFRTFKDGENGYTMTTFHGGGVSGIIGSVEFHLKQLVELGELAKHS